jgi:hydroxymethylpyrimidine/phosphomethylpyrimidine kinase
LVATPNLPELDALGGEVAVLAPGCSLLVKGGHAEGETVIDRLLEAGEGDVARWEAPRIATPHSHGTGCTLASAIATGLAQGMPLEPAIARARDFVRLALLDAPGLGQGHGPMGQQNVRNDGLFTGPALNQMTLPADDYGTSVAFYKQLGLTQIVDSPSNGYARFEAANGVTLSIHVGDGEPGGATTYLESGALDAWVAYLARRGVTFDQMPKDEEWGWREARLADPAGNPLCLYQAGEYRRYPPWRL